MRSWTTLRPDMINAYCLRRLIEHYECMQLTGLRKAGTHPDWITESRTILIIKDLHKRARPSNY